MKHRYLLAALLALFVFLVLMSSANTIGLTYDEGIYLSRGYQVTEWLQMLLSNPGEAVSDGAIRRFWDAKDEQPGAVKLIGALGQLTVGRIWGGYASGRAGTIVLFSLCTAALFLFASRLYGRATGLYAALALFTLPEVFVHAQLCALDVPVMATTLICLVLMEAGSRRGGWGLPIAAGCVWGIALGCKVNALFLPLFMVPWLFVYRRRTALRCTGSLVLAGIPAFLVTWPWLWHDTFTRFWEYLSFHLHHYPVNVDYFGVTYQYAPWHYPLVMTVLKTPEVTLGLVVVGLGVVTWRCASPPCPPLPPGEGGTAASPPGPLSTRGEGEQGHGGNVVGLSREMVVLILLGAAFNIGINSMPNAPKYTGTRLWMPFYPFYILFAAAGMHAITRWIGERGSSPPQPPSPAPDRPTAQRALSVTNGLGRGGSTAGGGTGLLTPQRLGWVAIALAVALPMRTLATVHPWEMSYYNSLIGGTAGADRRGMEVTYWGDAYFRALLWLNEKAPPGSTVWIEPVGMLSICRMYQAGIVRTDLRLIAGPWPAGGADYVIFQNKHNEWTPFAKRLVASGEPLYAERVDGVPVFFVYGGDGANGPTPSR